MEIITESPIIVQSEITTSKIEVLSITDSNQDRNIIANIRIADKECSVMLWELNAYDNLGQWTDEMVVARIKELIAEGKLC
jgi:hypothetical protein